MIRGLLSNNRVNATVRPVTPLAVASVAPVRPARYAVRWADWDDDLNGSGTDRTLSGGPHEFGGFVGTAVGQTACD